MPPGPAAPVAVRSWKRQSVRLHYVYDFELLSVVSVHCSACACVCVLPSVTVGARSLYLPIALPLALQRKECLCKSHNKAHKPQNSS